MFDNIPVVTHEGDTVTPVMGQDLPLPEMEMQSEEEQLPVEEAPKPKQDHPNFAALRAAKEKAERERDEYARRLQEREQSLEPEEDYEVNLGPDDLAEGKHLSKVAKKIKKLEDQIRNYEQKTHQITVETRLKTQYPDFDSVVNGETVEQLKTAYPELAQTLNSSTDLYSTAVTAYTMIKQLGLAPNAIQRQEKERALANAAKPRPLVSGNHQSGTSPLSQANAFANGLTDDLRAQLVKEMAEARRNI